MSYKDKSPKERLSHALRILNTGIGAEKENALKAIVTILTEDGQNIDYLADHPEILLSGGASQYQRIKAAYEQAMTANDTLAAQNDNLIRENKRLRIRVELWSAWTNAIAKITNEKSSFAAIRNRAKKLGGASLITAGYLTTGPIAHFIHENRKIRQSREWENNDRHKAGNYVLTSVLSAVFWLTAAGANEISYHRKIRNEIVDALKKNPCAGDQLCTPIYLEPQTRSLVFRTAAPAMRIERSQIRETESMITATGQAVTITCVEDTISPKIVASNENYGAQNKKMPRYCIPQ